MATTHSENLSEKKLFGVSSRSWEDNMRLHIKEMKFVWIEVN
jgi:hypothetical protein